MFATVIIFKLFIKKKTVSRVLFNISTHISKHSRGQFREKPFCPVLNLLWSCCRSWVRKTMCSAKFFGETSVIYTTCNWQPRHFRFNETRTRFSTIFLGRDVQTRHISHSGCALFTCSSYSEYLQLYKTPLYDRILHFSVALEWSALISQSINSVVK